jgi:uncharacterized protein YndB with AHSA1/START domain
MTDRSAVHAIFTIERTYAAVSPKRVFAAFATEAGKAAWFSAPSDEWTLVTREFDFRVGGRERLKGRWTSGVVTDFHVHYWDIVPDARIVYAYEMHHNDRKLSVSLATIEFKPAGAGTHLAITEQGVFLDGYDDAGSREHGANALMDRMGASLTADA